MAGFLLRSKHPHSYRDETGSVLCPSHAANRKEDRTWLLSSMGNPTISLQLRE